MKNIKTWLAIATILSLLGNLILGYWGKIQEREKNRYKNNYEISTTTEREYVDKNGILVKEKENLVLTMQDLKRSKDSTIRKLVTELAYSNIKLKRVNGLGNVTTETNNNFQIKYVKDTGLAFINIIDTVQIRTDHYSNEWVEYSRFINPINDSANVTIKTFHDLILVQSWEKKGKWTLKNIFVWRKKVDKTTVKDLNPYSEIKSVKFIDKK